MTPSDKMIGMKAREIARQQTLDQMEAQSLNAEKLVRVINEGLEANIVKVFFKHNGYSADDTDNTAGEQDKRLIYSDNIVDHVTRLKAAQMGLDLLDVMPDKRSELTLHDELSDMSEADLDRAIEEFDSLELDRPMTAADLIG